ncbi:FAD binding domain-containing protein [Aurantimonas endophytica]|uniref:Carbon-monoxide dehydrogenase medium subunit n=1 Tax=Aurantimonas endophytica TaxID=1522175 RepID=A0A7W6HBE8_9HYPH|nr:FAD binding domain-containing protein [Aurantimonas endophytica]MBB4002109.1 carbon-monoxide dehydrogenase medium subunit [Aurantimonas endophytica]MCO6402259.1 molybdopterin dehydrogenase [Aurantimonas endophytica]
MSQGTERQFAVADCIDMALAARRQGATVLAGGTWVMRDPLRGQGLPASVVVLSAIPAMTEIAIEADRITIGVSATHAMLADALRNLAGLEGLVAAAEGAANPAIRRVATVGGNLCTVDFPAADLVPAFLAYGAMVELATPEGTLLLKMPEFLKERRDLLGKALLTRLHLRRDVVASAHARLPLRKAGDYPAAIVSIAVDREGAIRVAVGAVETQARRWTSLEAALMGEPEALGLPDHAADLAREHKEFTGRDGVEAEGWYRCQVLPALVHRATAALPRLETRA